MSERTRRTSRTSPLLEEGAQLVPLRIEGPGLEHLRVVRKFAQSPLLATVLCKELARHIARALRRLTSNQKRFNRQRLQLVFVHNHAKLLGASSHHGVKKSACKFFAEDRC
eukprot:CAMPEP_0117479124 /NCGR_PEP_ID=MMETSP0784-20121206/11719_1 /TAXON_ID=39447 /ORGANISM="" /LENGTH=110 /DNA_ID=CAMNT_0005273533 /DNA_START=153 /DNA_END=482 /DNA_ORIENTATION=+